MSDDYKRGFEDGYRAAIEDAKKAAPEFPYMGRYEFAPEIVRSRLDANAAYQNAIGRLCPKPPA
jgi:hypothetical protein